MTTATAVAARDTQWADKLRAMAAEKDRYARINRFSSGAGVRATGSTHAAHAAGLRELANKGPGDAPAAETTDPTAGERVYTPGGSPKWGYPAEPDAGDVEALRAAVEALIAPHVTRDAISGQVSETAKAHVRVRDLRAILDAHPAPSVHRHGDGSECLWSTTDQRRYRMHPLYPLRECEEMHHG